MFARPCIFAICSEASAGESKGGIRMAKTPQFDQAQVKAAIEAIKDRKRPALVRGPQSAQLQTLRRNLGQRLQPLFAEAGLDKEKFNKILEQHQHEVRAAVEKERAANAKELSLLNENLRRGLANQARALEHIAFKPFITTLIPIPQASFIFAQPVGMLTDSNTAPGMNFAKVSYTQKNDSIQTTVFVRFYFFWQNQTDFLAVINVDSDLAAVGVAQGSAYPGFFVPGTCDLNLDATLTVYLGDTEISYQSTETAVIDSIHVTGGYDIFLPDGGFQSDDISGSFHLSCTNIEVEANQTVVFQVEFEATYTISDGGSVVLDFDFEDNSIVCPGVTVELLTPSLAP